MSKMKSELNLLITDENSLLYDLIKKSSLANNLNIYFCEAQEDILSFIKNNNINIVITDLDRNKTKGLALLKELKTFDSLLEVIIVGKPLASANMMELINHGATDYLVKPLQLDTLQKAIKKILEKRALRSETFLLEKRLDKKYFFQGIIGKSPYMLEVFSLIEKISKYFTSVLITGETGTGKEMVARAIHNLSHTKNKNLVICDCVSIPENLFESELFGYMKGAFTGADKNKKGLLEEAHEGIIFLDEIGEIPVSTQAKLLRVLDHHQYRPLGSNKIRKIETKVIVATNRNLRESIKNGTFREDLFHRLNRVEIHLPPLRKKPEDIPLLVRHLLNYFSKKFSKNLRGISLQVQKLFHRYEWPGNVRELENVLERASMLAKKEFIDITDLPKYLHYYLGLDRKNFLKNTLPNLGKLKKEYIDYLLELTNNDINETAEILNIPRVTLKKELNKYSLRY